MHYTQITAQAAHYCSADPQFAHWAAGDGVAVYDLLTALDRLPSAGIWLVVQATYARNVSLDDRPLTAEDLKRHPEGHTGGALNMAQTSAAISSSNIVGYLRENPMSA